MQIFEFHFNPGSSSPSLAFGKGAKKEKDSIFDSFCYVPENIYEKKLGSLYVVGKLTNPLPDHNRFLGNLASFIKKTFYTRSGFSPEKSLKESLKKANSFLEDIARNDDVSWLGNLNLAILNLKRFELNFTKVGEIKIILLRSGEIIDISKNLEFSGIEPYPLKVFGNIVSGKLSKDDVILILTKEIFSVFSKEKLLNKIAQLSLTALNTKDDKEKIIKGKSLREIFKAQKEELLNASGVCLLIFLNKEASSKERKAIFLQKPTQGLTLFQIFKSFGEIFKKVIPITLIKTKTLTQAIKLPQGKNKIKLLKPNLPSPRLASYASFFSKILKNRDAIPALPSPAKIKKVLRNFKAKKEIKKLLQNKSAILVLTLILFLVIGFFIFKKEEQKLLQGYQQDLNNIQEKTLQAENFLIFKNEKQADILFRQAWEDILPLTKIEPTLPADFLNQVLSLKQSIEENLFNLNGLEKIEDPQLLFEFEPEQFIPQKIVADKENIYFFSPYSQNLFEINPNGQGQLIESSQKFDLATYLKDSVLFFTRPDKIATLENGQLKQSFKLELFPSDLNFNDLSSYQSNLYFLDKKRGEIIKYSYLGNFEWGSPQDWLRSKIKKPFEVKSMTIDNSLWLLTKDNSINKYYSGQYQETINLDFFPYPENLSKIFTSPSLPYLYLLETAQNRIIILDKSGKIIKQFQSEKFDNLLDFTVSGNGKIIYLLNAQKVYQIKL
ncbi:hypothetical protein KKB68_01935 [Patescibacteria group bacterium]|nr:hypothetical protein [Patescibacteria group bacterium]